MMDVEVSMLITLFFITVLSGCEAESSDKITAASGTTPMNNSATDETLESHFKELGISKLPGIAPPTDVALKDMTGNDVKLSDLKGKIVFLNFWATWCPECVVEMPDMEKLHQNFINEDFIMIAVDLKESEKRVEKFMIKHKLTFKVLLDKKGKMGTAFGVRAIPTTYILNRKGGLIGRAMGAREWSDKKSMKLFNYLVENK